ncbi:MAG: hypothetical protein GY874_07155 [Desulfobacteraceae bacterium]|nr:hypothetical protein [Desulfobacteraceae bacterium]
MKTKIAFNIGLLLLLSALVTDVLVIIIFQTLWVRKEIQEQQGNVNTLSQILLYSPVFENMASNQFIGQKRSVLNFLSEHYGLESLVIVDLYGKVSFRFSKDNQNSNFLDQYALQGLKQGLKKDFIYQKNIGREWGFFWWHPKQVMLAFNIVKDSKKMGAAAVIIPINHIFKQIRKQNKPIIFYIVINSVIFAIIGFYQILKIHLRPIDRIILQAAEYREDDDLLFSFRREDDGLNKLSTALNRMLKRISHDKQNLKTAVQSLEKANNEIKKTQKELIRGEKMASVGRLAAGFAHEIGNPIGIVLGYIDLLKQDDIPSSDKKDFLQRAEKEIQRINTIIRQLLDLARPKESHLRWIYVHEIIDEVTKIMTLQPIMREIKIVLNLQAQYDGIMADDEQIRQVFLNLYINAADAIKSCPQPWPGQIKVNSYNKNDYDMIPPKMLIIEVCDNGAGIEPSLLENIFDPFFTTKEPGKGTGLGLSVCYMLLEKLGGKITVYSELEKGTTFRIRLPQI